MKQLKLALLLMGIGHMAWAQDLAVHIPKDAVKITTELELSKRMLPHLKEIMDHKINKNLLKYLNTEKAVGYLSYAYNTEAYLKLYTKVLPQLFLGPGAFKSEPELGDLLSDFISLLLDEKAIARCFKGDALMVLTGVSQKQTSYTSFEYNEESGDTKNIERTRTEPKPEYLILFSSDDTELLTKLLRFGIKKNKIQQEKNIYSIANLFDKKNADGFHLLIKDGIVFLASNKNDLLDVENNRFAARLDKTQKKKIRNSNFTLHFDPERLKTIQLTDKKDASDQKLLNLLTHMGPIQMETHQLKGNLFSGEMTARVPKENENALKYLFNLIDLYGYSNQKEDTVELTGTEELAAGIQH